MKRLLSGLLGLSFFCLGAGGAAAEGKKPTCEQLLAADGVNETYYWVYVKATGEKNQGKAMNEVVPMYAGCVSALLDRELAKLSTPERELFTSLREQAHLYTEGARDLRAAVWKRDNGADEEYPAYEFLVYEQELCYRMWKRHVAPKHPVLTRAQEAKFARTASNTARTVRAELKKQRAAAPAAADRALAAFDSIAKLVKPLSVPMRGLAMSWAFEHHFFEDQGD